MTSTREYWEHWRPGLRVLVPIVIIAAGVWFAYYLYENRPQPITEQPTVFTPLVECTELQPTSTRLDITASGIVRPRTSTALVAEVTARVVKISPSLEAGGFFAQGEVLVEFERRDYELALVQAEGRVADARLALALEEAEAESSVEEWHANSDEPAPELVQRLPQLASARAMVRSAEAAVDAAELDLERTAVAAPYAGRVRNKQVDIGQFVNRGSQLAEIYTIDAVEIRLPLHDRDLAFVDVPLRSDASTRPAEGTNVTVRADFGGTQHEWNGWIVRTEGEIGERSRMIYAIVEIRDPYSSASNGAAAHRTPLLLGMFVEATIAGRGVDDVFLIPRHAVHEGNRVLIVRDDGTITVRAIDVLRTRDGVACVRHGLAAGERLCTTPLEVFTEGMHVRIAGDEAKTTPDPAIPEDSDR